MKIIINNINILQTKSSNNQRFSSIHQLLREVKVLTNNLVTLKINQSNRLSTSVFHTTITTKVIKTSIDTNLRNMFTSQNKIMAITYTLKTRMVRN